MQRRTLLTIVGPGSFSIAGCMELPTSAGSEDLPDECPLSQDTGVDWPRDLDEPTVSRFIERYEEAYYRQYVIDTLYEPRSRLFGYEGWISRIKGVTAVEGGGWRVHFSGVVNIRRGDLALVAETSDLPEEAEAIPVSEVEHERLVELLHEAAETGRTEEMIEPSTADEYLNLFEGISDDFELTHVGDSATLYFSTDDETVELAVTWFAPNRDHFWDAWYYVDEQVVWRSDEASVDPRDAELLECRTST